MVIVSSAEDYCCRGTRIWADNSEISWSSSRLLCDFDKLMLSRRELEHKALSLQLEAITEVTEGYWGEGI